MRKSRFNEEQIVGIIRIESHQIFVEFDTAGIPNTAFQIPNIICPGIEAIRDNTTLMIQQYNMAICLGRDKIVVLCELHHIQQITRIHFQKKRLSIDISSRRLKDIEALHLQLAAREISAKLENLNIKPERISARLVLRGDQNG